MRNEQESAGRESSAAIRARVIGARNWQKERFGATSSLNCQLEGGELRASCRLDSPSTSILEAAIEKFCLSARGCDRVLRVSRTIADLAGVESIAVEHVAEAVQYRFREPAL